MEKGNLTDGELHELFVATLSGDWPSRSGVRLVAKAIGGPDLSKQIKALGVFAKAGNKDEKQRAWSGLRMIMAKRVANLSPEDKFNLVFVLMQCLDEEHLAEQQFRDYTYKIADDVSISIRCNALIILKRLADNGDERALALLKRAVNDPDERVGLNARTFLSVLGA